MNSDMNVMDKQYLIGVIWRDLVARGNDVSRSHCGRYVTVNHGVSSYYDDLAFMVREWRRLATA